LASKDSAHLYEGLLTVLMRLVFILYAEDRDLLPSRKNNHTPGFVDLEKNRQTAHRASRRCRATQVIVPKAVRRACGD
jgi:hypothetical protein